MPHRRTNHRRDAYVFPEDFPQGLERLKEASGMTWAEMAGLLGTSVLNLWRWRGGVRPNAQHLLALQDMAESRGLGHLLPTARLRRPS